MRKGELDGFILPCSSVDAMRASDLMASIVPHRPASRGNDCRRLGLPGSAGRCPANALPIVRSSVHPSQRNTSLNSSQQQEGQGCRDGSIVAVACLLNGTEPGQATEEPWTHSTTTASLSGTVTLQARAMDDDGRWFLSQGMQLRISELGHRPRWASPQPKGSILVAWPTFCSLRLRAPRSPSLKTENYLLLPAVWNWTYRGVSSS